MGFPVVCHRCAVAKWYHDEPDGVGWGVSFLEDAASWWLMLWWVGIMVIDSSGGGSLGDLWLSNFFGLTLSRLNWTPPEAKEKKSAFS